MPRLIAAPPLHHPLRSLHLRPVQLNLLSSMDICGWPTKSERSPGGSVSGSGQGLGDTGVRPDGVSGCREKAFLSLHISFY